MNVLSLFDGMSCGQIALKELSIPVDKYYASEIDTFAIDQTKLNFPDTIQLGSVSNWKKWDIDWSSIDLVIGGSPCQGFSFAGKQLAFEDPRSVLFFEFVHVVDHVKKHNPKVKFLLENVQMAKQHLKVINDFMGIHPVEINSSLVSAQNRVRLYWTNIKTIRTGLFNELHTNIPQPRDKKIFLKDILESDVPSRYNMKVPKPVITENYIQFDISGKGYKSQQDRAYFSSKKHGALAASRTPTKTCVVKIGKDGKIKNNQNKASTLTGGAHSGGNHSDMDLIIQKPRGFNEGGVFYDKTPTLTSCSWQTNNILLSDCIIRRLTPTECARLQTIPDWYKWKCSNSQQYKMLGNGWTVDVIKHIFSYLKQ